jgi:ribosomal protein S18 acetylase RimI-like enzyme
MRQGHVYGKFTTSDGRKILLRTLATRDLDPAVRFVNSLVKERAFNRDLGILMDRKVTRKDEKQWLARRVKGIRSGASISVAAFHDGKLVGNCEVTRQSFQDVRHCGTLGIAIVDGYRGVGLGRRMLEVLLDASKRSGVTLVELAVLSINRRAIALYRDLGFRKYGTIPGKIRRGRRRIDESMMFWQA